MNVQDIIKDSDPKRIQQFLANAGQEPRDEDVYQMAKMIVDQGMSAYQAAKTRAESGASIRSIYTLYYHSRLIVSEIYRYLTGDISDVIAELSKNGEVYIPQDLVPEVKKAAIERGWEVREDIRVRIIKRNIATPIESSLSPAVSEKPEPTATKSKK